MRLQRGGRPEDINQSNKHKLFVEGKKNNQDFDKNVIKELLNSNGLNVIDVQTMGGCENVRSAAQSLISEHPTYYFLIDRDDQNQEIVNESWGKFPDIEAYNMLIWKKRELENYFINQDYIEQSNFLKENPKTNVRERVLKECQQRLYLDSVNLTLLYLSRELQRPLAISHFKNKHDFKNKDAGITKLEYCFQAIDERKEKIVNLFENNEILDIYSNFVAELSGGITPLQYGSGTWLERISGKEVFHVIANDCFQVKNAFDEILTGDEQNIEIAKALVRLPLEQQSLDFQELVKLLKIRIER